MQLKYAFGVIACAGVALGPAGVALGDSRQTIESLGVKAILGVELPAAGVVGVDGQVWTMSPELVMNRVDVRTGKAREVSRGTFDAASLPMFATPQMVVGADGRLVWAGEAYRGWVIVRRDVDGALSVVSLRKAGVPVSGEGVTDVEVGPDGAVWFAAAGVVGKVSERGRVSWWRIPRGRLGYAAGRARNVKLVVGADGQMWFSAYPGMGRVSRSGRFSRLLFSFGETTMVARGGDERIWVLQDEGRAAFRINPDRTLTRFDLSSDEERWRYPSIVAAPGGAFSIMGLDDDTYGPFGDDVVFTGTDASGAAFGRYIGTPSGSYGNSTQSPGRTMMLWLPDGRLWVGVTDWNGIESYENSDVLGIRPVDGAVRLLRADRAGGTVRVRVKCVGPTGGWCQQNVKVAVAGHGQRSRGFTVAAAPTKVNSRTMVRLRLSSAQLAAVKRGARVTVSIGAKRIAVRP